MTNGSPLALRPQPVPDADTAEFWARMAAGEFSLQACRRCGRLRFYPQPICPHCHSLEFEWRALSGRGRIASWTVVHHAVNPYFKERVPYTVVLVGLDEDPSVRLIANLTPESEGRPLQLSAPVAMRIVGGEGEASVYEFDLLPEQRAAAGSGTD